MLLYVFTVNPLIAYITLGQAYHGLHQTKGIAIIPKMMVDVMSCEVARLLQLTQNAVVPISYHVQRKVVMLKS